MTLLHAAPTLDEIAHDPGRAAGLLTEERARLLARALAVVGALAAPAVSHNGSAPAEDRLLDVEETARRLGVSTDYVYRHHSTWPFTVRRGRKLGFSEQGLADYLRREQERRRSPLADR